MSTPMEQRQRETDRQLGEHERRMMDRARFGSPLAADLWETGVAAMNAQLSEADAKRNRAAAESDELKSEGRCHVNTRPDRNGP